MYVCMYSMYEYLNIYKYVVKANEKGPITQIKNPIIYNQRPKFKDLTFKIPICM